MPDNSRNSNNALDLSVADIERALTRFQKTLHRHTRSRRKKSARRAQVQRLATKSLAGVFKMLTSGDASAPRTRGNTANRFPTSTGQLFADLASTLQGFMGRNL